MIKQKKADLFPVFIAACLLLSSCYYSRQNTHKLLLKAIAAEPYDLIIVPGTPLYNGKWNKTMKGRVYWSKYLFDKGITRNIMYSGSSVYSPYYEAEVMKLYAIAIGIPGQNIFTEKKAEHSTENVYYSYKYATKLGFKRIALASDSNAPDGCHLHFEVRTQGGGVSDAVDPARLLQLS